MCELAPHTEATPESPAEHRLTPLPHHRDPMCQPPEEPGHPEKQCCPLPSLLPSCTFLQGLEDTSNEALNALLCWVVRMVLGRLGRLWSLLSSEAPFPAPGADLQRLSSSSLLPERRRRRCREFPEVPAGGCTPRQDHSCRQQPTARTQKLPGRAKESTLNPGQEPGGPGYTLCRHSAPPWLVQRAASSAGEPAHRPPLSMR